jgi:hypothetical protein
MIQQATGVVMWTAERNVECAYPVLRAQVAESGGA